MMQVLANLLTNALKYSTGHSSIDVRLEGLGDEVRVEVRNAGPAIPKDVQERLFEPMERGAEKSGRSRGLGLGLYIAKHIITAHGGRVDVGSSEEGGTTFTITLPRTAERATDDDRL